MRRTGARAATIAAAVFMLAGSATFAAPGIAADDAGTAETTAAGTTAGETKTVPCGGTVTAKPGDRIIGVTALGLKLDLGAVTDGIGSLLNGLCRVTVTVVDTVVEPVPVVGKPAADAVNDTVTTTTDTVGKAVDQIPGVLPKAGTAPAPKNPGQPAPANPGSGPSGTPGARGSAMPAPNSPVAGGATVPGFSWLASSLGSGFAALRDYGGIPMATAGLFAPSPGVRYGGQVPGYSPEFGVLGQDSAEPDTGVRDVGRADALPGGSGDLADDTGLATILAVLTLSGVTAALVRTWVLRRE